MEDCRICQQRCPLAPAGGDTLCDFCAQRAAYTVGFFRSRVDIARSDRWFHVSPYRMGTGTLLTPGAARNPANVGFYRAGYGRDSGVLRDMGVCREDVVWLSPTIEDAAFWAVALDARHCYRVQPTNDPRPWNGTGTDGWVTDTAIVVNEVTDAFDAIRKGNPPMCNDMACAICREQTLNRAGSWIHSHTRDEYCGTGDGSTAFPLFLFIENETALKDRE